MARLVLGLFLGLGLTVSLQAGRNLRVQGQGYVLLVEEPEGWKTDFNSVRQIANFVMFPDGISWRDAEVAVFAQILPRGAENDLESFMKEDQEQFAEQCPFYETDSMAFKGTGEHPFLTRFFYCPGRRHEVLAVTQVPGFFAAFVLTSDQKTRLEEARPSFEEILTSFRWETQERLPQPNPQ